MVETQIVHICREYARLECKARIAERDGHDRYASVFRASAHYLYDHAPFNAISFLDDVKKVLEIDTATTSLDLILMRASVL